MAGTNHHINYSAEDFRRYHAGEMSAAERHALEKAALDDPFLSDALDGYVLTTTPANDIAELKQRLAQKDKRNRVFFLSPASNAAWLRIAALFILLAGTGWLVYRFGIAGNNQDVAINQVPQTKTPAPASIPADTTATADTASMEISLKPAAPIVAQTEQPAIQNKKPAKQTAARQKDKPAAETSDVATTTTTEPVLAERTDDTINQEKDANTLRKSNVVASAPALSTRVFKGQVIDNRGNPLPYVTVVNNRNRQATSTDAQGYFKMPAQDSLLNATVSAVGFESNQLKLTNPENDHTIVLQESSASLNEVVVTGMGQSKKREARKMVTETTGELEPAEGWAKFDDYVINNLRIPETEAVKPTGEVGLVFEINSDGEPTNIRVVKSLCEACDKEAIRLLKEGPAWKKKKGKKGRINIRFR